MKKPFLFLFFIMIIATVLRFYQLTADPPGLYVDEVAIGYNAYTILHTGKDEYGTPFPLAFKSYGDYKMPVYIYLTAGSIFLFGENEFAIRFPAAFFGTLTVLLFYFFCKELLSYSKGFFEKHHEQLSLASTFLLAISTWHIQFSRAGFEVTVALFFFLMGCYLSLLFWKREKFFFAIASFFFFLLSFYTYHSYRAIVPVVLPLLVIIFFLKKPKLRGKIIGLAIASFLIALPLVLFSFTGQGSARFTGTSTFAEYQQKSLASKLYLYPTTYVRNYLSYFSTDFLFNNGDGIGRHEIPGFGVLLYYELPLLLLGILYFLKQKKSIMKSTMLFLLFIAPFPAAVALPSPHALRSLLMVIPVTFFCALGAVAFIHLSKRYRYPLLCIYGLFVLYNFAYYLHFYYSHYPITNSLDWGGGYKQVVMEARKYTKNVSYIVVDKNLNELYMKEYIHFYNNNLHPIYADVTWRKPLSWRNAKVLYIRPYYGQKTASGIIENITLPNHDIFAQFWLL